jgi:hypothetical protein
MNRINDFHCFRSDPPIRRRAIAAALESNPAVWDWALNNIGRFFSRHRVHTTSMQEWRQWLLRAAEIRQSVQRCWTFCVVRRQIRITISCAPAPLLSAGPSPNRLSPQESRFPPAHASHQCCALKWLMMRILKHHLH